MAITANTGSIVQGPEGESVTRTSVSTNIIIEVDGNKIGAVKNLSVTEARSVSMIDEVGTDGHIDSVPNKSTDISGSCKRTRFGNLRIAAAFSRPFIHAASQRIPFDIIIKDIFASEADSTTLTTVIKNVWITQISYQYQDTDFVIVDDMNWQAEAIYSTMGPNSGAVPIPGGPIGSRDMPLTDLNPIEQATDKGDFRGALTAGGLLFAIDETA